MPYAYVNSAINNKTSNSITYSPTPGNLAVLLSCTSQGAGSPTLTAVKDNNNVSWSQGVATFTYDSGTTFASAYYLANCEAGIVTITGTYNGGNPSGIELVIIEYSGIALSSALINATHNTQAAPGTGANAVISGAVSVAAPALCLGIIVDDSGGNPIGAGTSPNAFTSRFSDTSVADILLQDFRLTTSGTVGSTATASQGSSNYGSMFLAFAEAGGSMQYQPFTSTQFFVT